MPLYRDPRATSARRSPSWTASGSARATVAADASSRRLPPSQRGTPAAAAWWLRPQNAESREWRWQKLRTNHGPRPAVGAFATGCGACSRGSSSGPAADALRTAVGWNRGRCGGPGWTPDFQTVECALQRKFSTRRESEREDGDGEWEWAEQLRHSLKPKTDGRCVSGSGHRD